MLEKEELSEDPSTANYWYPRSRLQHCLENTLCTQTHDKCWNNRNIRGTTGIPAGTYCHQLSVTQDDNLRTWTMHGSNNCCLPVWPKCLFWQDMACPGNALWHKPMRWNLKHPNAARSPSIAPRDTFLQALESLRDPMQTPKEHPRLSGKSKGAVQSVAFLQWHAAPSSHPWEHL